VDGGDKPGGVRADRRTAKKKRSIRVDAVLAQAKDPQLARLTNRPVSLGIASSRCEPVFLSCVVCNAMQ